VFPNLRRMHENWNLAPSYTNNSLFISSDFFPLHKKEIFPWEHGNRELPQHNALGFLCWERSLKIHIETKRELFTTLGEIHVEEHIISIMDIPPFSTS
jgi:hypothetical protein